MITKTFVVQAITTRWRNMMLNQQTIDKLRDLRLGGMLLALVEQEENPEYNKLSFEERVGFLVDREWTEKKSKKLKNRVSKAKFRERAVIEDVDYSPERTLDRYQILNLAQPEWIKNNLNVITIGATGTGKTYLACAIGQRACQNGFTVRYYQTSKLLREIQKTTIEGTYTSFLKKLSKIDLLIIDDWLLDELNLSFTRAFLEIIDDKFNNGSIIFSTQLPVSEWYSRFKDPTLADAIMDRVVHSAYKIEIKGPSIRKKRGKKLTQSGQ